MAISFYNEGILFDLEQKLRHKQWIRKIIKSHLKVPGDINFIFTSNELLRLKNREYLNHNYYTDVLAFDNSEKKITGGDVFISIEQVKKNSVLYGVSHKEELRRVMIHGVLHLLGFSDSSSEEKQHMQEKENDALHLWLNLA